MGETNDRDYKQVSGSNSDVELPVPLYEQSPDVPADFEELASAVSDEIGAINTQLEDGVGETYTLSVEGETLALTDSEGTSTNVGVKAGENVTIDYEEDEITISATGGDSDGLPPGGTTNQVLTKLDDDADGEADWRDPQGGEGGSGGGVYDSGWQTIDGQKFRRVNYTVFGQGTVTSNSGSVTDVADLTDTEFAPTHPISLSDHYDTDKTISNPIYSEGSQLKVNSQNGEDVVWSGSWSTTEPIPGGGGNPDGGSGGGQCATNYDELKDCAPTGGGGPTPDPDLGNLGDLISGEPDNQIELSDNGGTQDPPLLYVPPSFEVLGGVSEPQHFVGAGRPDHDTEVHSADELAQLAAAPTGSTYTCTDPDDAAGKNLGARVWRKTPGDWVCVEGSSPAVKLDAAVATPPGLTKKGLYASGFLTLRRVPNAVQARGNITVNNHSGNGSVDNDSTLR